MRLRSRSGGSTPARWHTSWRSPRFGSRGSEKAKLALALLWIAIGFLARSVCTFVFHEFLFGAVPGFRAVRVPARWAVIAYIGLAMLIALATAALARRNRRIALLVPAAFLVALWAGPIRWYLADPRPPAVDRWLAGQRVRAIAEMPIDTGSSEYNYLLRATAHHQHMINGVSGFSPPGRDALAAICGHFPRKARMSGTLANIPRGQQHRRKAALSCFYLNGDCVSRKEIENDESRRLRGWLHEVNGYYRAESRV